MNKSLKIEVTKTNLGRAIQAAKKLIASHDINIIEMVTEEGPEDCGFGGISVTATLRGSEYGAGPKGPFAISGNNSAWRNYGAPSGTRYTLDFTITW